MARVRAFIVFVLAITAGGALAFGTYNYMQKQPATATSVATQKVVVAAADLDIGTELRPEDLKVIDWPANSTPSGAFSKPEELVGRGVVLPMIQYEPVLPAKLA